MIAERVAIVGGGFSGAMTAINLARFGGPPATVFERDGAFGPGVAFGGRDLGQVLNVRANNMSAYPDDPGHFERWLRAEGLSSNGFARRTDYGRYLAEEFDRTAAESPERIERVESEAVAADAVASGWRIHCRQGPPVDATTLVLATGLLPPKPPSGIDPASLPPGAYIADPWREDFTAGLVPGDRVLLIGTGLTMVDVALALAELPHPPRIDALSRRGLVPQPHAAPAAAPPMTEAPPVGMLALISSVREQTSVLGWRAAIDRLRPHTQAIWQRLSHGERGRFLRHLRPYWDVHRHRMAPELAQRIAQLEAEGVLTIHAGRLDHTMPAGPGVHVLWQPRGSAVRIAQDYARVINCTGPATLDEQTAGPLLGGLLESGTVVRDPMGLGVEVDQRSRVLGVDGRANDRLYALGALTRGRFWEISAVPDIRVQAWWLARRLSNAHWVEGEGL
jgi:uncharacterized NAD(P)/FAD-binding protein YdhS